MGINSGIVYEFILLKESKSRSKLEGGGIEKRGGGRQKKLESESTRIEKKVEGGKHWLSKWMRFQDNKDEVLFVYTEKKIIHFSAKICRF